MITLRTMVGEDPKMSMRYEWFRDLHGLAHDAAVAHALERAMGEADKHHVLDWVSNRAAEILRTNFGIE